MTTHDTNSNISNDKLLNKKEACQALGGIGYTKFYSLLANGEIQGCKIGVRTFVRQSEIDRYINSLPVFETSQMQE